MKIAILDDYQNVISSLICFKQLGDHEVSVFNDTPSSQSQLAERLKDQDCLVLIRERTKIDESLLSLLPKLKLISQTGKISNHLNLEACSKYKVAVAEGKGSPIAPTELCWSLILAASRHIVPYSVNLRQGQWQSSDNLGLGRVVNGLKMGIWGYGKIGQRIAQYAKAFGMDILVWGSEGSREKAVSHGFEAAATRQDFFSQADVLSLHLRLNDKTRGCVTYDDLQLMKKDALLVNISRAELIETGALARALSEGRPGFAALDVYDCEPVKPDVEPLLSLPNVLCSPHIGYVEKNGYELYFRVAFENVVKFFKGQPENIANPEILPL